MASFQCIWGNLHPTQLAGGKEAFLLDCDCVPGMATDKMSMQQVPALSRKAAPFHWTGAGAPVEWETESIGKSTPPTNKTYFIVFFFPSFHCNIESL
jgi:hypothetical protein